VSVQREQLQIALQITGVSFDTGLESTFYFSNSGFTAFIAGDTEERFYEPLLKDSILLQRKLGNTNDSMNVRLINKDQNYLNDYLFHDRSMKIYVKSNFAPSSNVWYPLFIGECDTLLVKRKTVEIKAKSHFDVLTKVINPEVFTGVPANFEGEIELKDKTKPRLFGDVFNITPVLLKSNTLVYGCNWDYAGARAAVASIDAVKDGGGALTFTADYATTALMDAATAPISGNYHTCLAEGTIKLGSKPVYDITIDVKQVTKTVTDFVNFLVSELSLNGSVIHFAPSYTFGLYQTSSTTYVKLFKSIIDNLDVIYWFDAVGDLNVNTVRGYELNTPLVRFLDAGQDFIDNTDIIAFKVEKVEYEFPPKQINLGYQKNYTIQNTGDLSGLVNVKDIEVYKNEYLKTSALLTCNVALYNDLETVDIDSNIRYSADAVTETAAWLAHRNQINDIFEVTCPILASNTGIVLGVMTNNCTGVRISSTTVLISDTNYLISNNDSTCDQHDALDLGDTVTINSEYFEIDDDKFVVIGINVNTKRMLVTYKLLGFRPITACP